MKSINESYQDPLQRLYLHSGTPPLDFNAAKRLADAQAEATLGEGLSMGLSWYDRERDLISPRGSDECHENCTAPAWEDYAIGHDGCLLIDIDAGRFVFTYRSLSGLFPE